VFLTIALVAATVIALVVTRGIALHNRCLAAERVTLMLLTRAHIPIL